MLSKLKVSLKPCSQPPVRAPTGSLRAKFTSFRSFSYGQPKSTFRNLSTQGRPRRPQRIKNMSNKFYDRLRFVLYFEVARDTLVLRKGKPRCKYGLELHGDARLATATARLAHVSRMLGACVPYFVSQTCEDHTSPSRTPYILRTIERTRARYDFDQVCQSWLLVIIESVQKQIFSIFTSKKLVLKWLNLQVSIWK